MLGGKFLFRIEDGGAVHWAIAESPEQAIELAKATVMDEQDDESWDAVALGRDESFTYQLMSGETVELTAEDWVELYHPTESRYLACSEW